MGVYRLDLVGGIWREQTKCNLAVVVYRLIISKHTNYIYINLHFLYTFEILCIDTSTVYVHNVNKSEDGTVQSCLIMSG